MRRQQTGKPCTFDYWPLVIANPPGWTMLSASIPGDFRASGNFVSTRSQRCDATRTIRRSQRRVAGDGADTRQTGSKGTGRSARRARQAADSSKQLAAQPHGLAKRRSRSVLHYRRSGWCCRGLPATRRIHVVAVQTDSRRTVWPECCLPSSCIARGHCRPAIPTTGPERTDVSDKRTSAPCLVIAAPAGDSAGTRARVYGPSSATIDEAGRPGETPRANGAEAGERPKPVRPPSRPANSSRIGHGRRARRCRARQAA